MSYSANSRGTLFKGGSRQTSTGYQNGTMSTMTAATLVSSNSVGNAVLLDVSSESLVESFIGLTADSIISGASGQIVSDGRLENIPLGLGFSIGDTLWAGVIPGSLTNVKPDLDAPGWTIGMFVVFIGVVVKNEFNGAQQDIQLSRTIIGQL